MANIFYARRLSKKEIRAALSNLIRAGLVVPNGKYRRARNGTMQPVYVVADPELGEEQVAERLAELHDEPPAEH
jgi:hypothetical protein